MKKVFIVLLSMLVYTQLLSQQKITDLVSNAKESASDTLEMIYDLNVFEYFDIDTTYDTELKKAIFKKTVEYQNYLTQIKNLKTEMLKKTYYIKLEDRFNDIEYNLKRGGFEINLGENDGFGTLSAKTPKSIKGILFNALPAKQVPIEQGISQEILFIPLNENNGLDIENNKENIDLYFFFVPSGKEKTTFKWYVMGAASYAGWYNITLSNIKSDKVRIIITNKLSDAIYFDKIYSYYVPVHK